MCSACTVLISLTLLSLQAVLEDVTYSSMNGQQRDKDEKGTQTEFEACTAMEDVVVEIGDSQPKSVPFGVMSVGIVSPLAVPAPPLSPELIFSPLLQHMSSDMDKTQV